MNAGLFHTRKLSNASPAQLLKGTAAKTINKKSNRRPSKSKTEILKANAIPKIPPTQKPKYGPPFTQKPKHGTQKPKCVPSQKSSKETVEKTGKAGTQKPKLKAKARVDCWRGRTPRRIIRTPRGTIKLPKGENRTPQISLKTPQGNAVLSGRKKRGSQACSTRKSTQKRRSHLSAAGQSEQKEVEASQQGTSSNERANIGYTEISYDEQKLQTPYQPAAFKLNISGGKNTPCMRMLGSGITYVPRTSSVLRSKSQTKRNLRSGSYRSFGGMGSVRGLVQKLEQSRLAPMQVLAKFSRRKESKRSAKPVGGDSNIVDMNHNIHDAHHTPLGLKKRSTPAAGSDGKSPTSEDHSFEDEVFDTISHPPILLPKIIVQHFDASYCHNKSVNDEILDESICLNQEGQSDNSTSGGGPKMNLGVEIDESMSSTNSDEYQLANETNNSAVTGFSSANNSSDRIEFALEATKFWDANETVVGAADKDRERQGVKELGGEEGKVSEEIEKVEEEVKGEGQKVLEEEGGKASESSPENRVGSSHTNSDQHSLRLGRCSIS
eukprot:TRINITY_DN3906_c0_g1_i1.p1 TRINITY_DN3906_c0_g1~~TRINITY_DN3906_c0_g1_i1.p1  ORF type:complete len:599 (+),score=127.28 TRINITY_DN3906_c0_g1_i1:146-1798(+)